MSSREKKKKKEIEPEHIFSSYNLGNSIIAMAIGLEMITALSNPLFLARDRGIASRLRGDDDYYA